MPKVNRLCSKGTLHGLFQRELALTRSAYRISLRIMKDLVCSEGTTFLKVWEIESKKRIAYAERKLFFDNYRECLAMCGRNGLPTKLYHLEQKKFGKIESTLTYSCPVNEPNFDNPSSFKSSLIVLTSSNWLCNYDSEKGHLLQSVYMGPSSRCKFLHIDWDRQGETFTVSTIKYPLRETDPASSRVLVAIALFSVFPLEFIALMEFDKEVFGKECVHCNVSEGLLIVGTGTVLKSFVRLYDFYDAINHGMLYSCKIGESCTALDGDFLGTFPSGVPVNCKVTEAPPILFQVLCSEYAIYFGCFPFHFVRSLPKESEVFQVYDVANQKMVKNGEINIPSDGVEPCHISFHSDDSGRIIHYSNEAVRFFKLVDEEKECKSLIQCSIINLAHIREPKVAETNRPKRHASKPRYSDFDYLTTKTFLCDDYENEIDVFLVLAVFPNSRGNDLMLHLYDNLTEKKIKSMRLNLEYDELSDYEVTLDLDLLMITEKTAVGRFKCSIFCIRDSYCETLKTTKTTRPSKCTRRTRKEPV